MRSLREIATITTGGIVISRAEYWRRSLHAPPIYRARSVSLSPAAVIL